MAKTWFITGTSSGFGRTLTEKLLERGGRVAATLRNVNALDALAAHFGDRLWIAALNVTDTQAVGGVVVPWQPVRSPHGRSGEGRAGDD